MATSWITRPRARTFGILVKGANVHRSANPMPFNTSQLPHPTGRNVIRMFVSATVTARPQPSAAKILPTPDSLLVEELKKASTIVASETIPDEKAVQGALQICENLARSLAKPNEHPKTPLNPKKGPTSNLLSLEEGREGRKEPPAVQARQAASIRDRIADSISVTAYKIITDSKVFITPTLLATYVYTQSILGRPKSFPLIFDLYASKPAPKSGASSIEYKTPNPNRASSAIPLVLAHTALEAAIQAKDLPLCLSIIDTSVCATAFIRNKVLRKAFLPFSVLALAPAAAYVLASNLAQYQYSMDTQMATNMAFVGIMAYITFTSIIGVVAITTSNDQMDRITWAIGTPLRDRWLREDERALVDRVAGAWGFQDLHMRGEEEGPEWEALREWAGTRGLILDKPDLMEGME